MRTDVTRRTTLFHFSDGLVRTIQYGRYLPGEHSMFRGTARPLERGGTTC
jgi:hypothetical protein